MEKIVLPIKTKIAAWWIEIIGCLKIIMGSLFKDYAHPFRYRFFYLMIDIFSGVLLFFLGYLLFKRNKKGWWVNVIFLSVILIFTIGPFFSTLLFRFKSETLGQILIKHAILPSYLPFEGGPSPAEMWLAILTRFVYGFIFLIPFILLLFDWKNFWKVAS